MFTIEQANQWASKNATELNHARLHTENEDVQFFNKIAPEKSKELWDSGCWLGDVLREMGASDDQISQIQMAQGQRAFFGDAWQAAVDYANEFESTGDTEEKGGPELAEKRHRELFGEGL